MAAAIPCVFPHMQHWLYWWHVLKKYKQNLNKLYAEHNGMKECLVSVINHPLTPREFKNAWENLVRESTASNRARPLLASMTFAKDGSSHTSRPCTMIG